MRVYSTIPIEVTRIGEHLNTISKTVARNPVIEEVTGQDFIVYLTYSYDSDDALGWIASSSYGVYQGTRNAAAAETAYAITSTRHFYGASWYATEKEALEAQEKYEAAVIEYATQIDSSPADANLNSNTDWVEWPSSTPSKSSWVRKFLGLD